MPPPRSEPPVHRHRGSSGGPARSDLTLTLADGDTVGYSEFGDPDGGPVLALHGSPNCGLGYAFLEGPARHAGVRLVAPDRPGIRESTARPGYTVADVGLDVVAVAEALELDRPGLVGWSGGGPGVLAAAGLAPERFGEAVVVAGIGPWDWPGLPASLSAADRVTDLLARRAPPLARALMAAAVGAARRAPGRAEAGLVRSLVPSERAAWTAQPPEDRNVEAFVESARHGTRGIVDDFRSTGRPWGIVLERVARPIVLWQGELDSVVHPSTVDELARRLPQAIVRRFPGEGHFLIMSHAEELMAVVG